MEEINFYEDADICPTCERIETLQKRLDSTMKKIIFLLDESKRTTEEINIILGDRVDNKPMKDEQDETLQDLLSLPKTLSKQRKK